MTERSVKSQVGGGFMLAGKLLAGGAWLGLVLGGITEALSPASDFGRIGSHRALGWVLLALASTIFLWTMPHWAKVFPGICGIGAIGAIGSIFAGHAYDPRASVTQTQAVVATVVFVGAGLFTIRFKGRNFTPRLPDRLAAFALVFGVFWSAVDSRMADLALGIGFFALFAAWLRDRLQRRRQREHRHASAPNPTRMA